jgi:hypothetical protein
LNLLFELERHRLMSMLTHPTTRREILQVGTIGLMGLSLTDVMRQQASGSEQSSGDKKIRSVIYVFLSGGLSQHESFDMKPLAPDTVRGEFFPISTKTPGLQICEHLPELAKRSDQWSLVRSLSHARNDHGQSIHIMSTGRSQLPPGLNRNKPQPTDFPSMLSVAGSQLEGPGGLPATAVLPRLITNVNRATRPGQSAGMMGPAHDPWLINASDKCDGYGDCPNCFHFSNKPSYRHSVKPVFQAPVLNLPDGLSLSRLDRRTDLLADVEQQRRDLDWQSAVSRMDRHRAGALSLLTSGDVRKAFDLKNEHPRRLDAYGRSLFGSSMLLARRLVQVGVRMVQVNLGRGSTWDQHGDLFPALGRLLPPFDQSLSALLDDLRDHGMLESTLVVVAGEFGRTPKISKLSVYKRPGRDHWGAAQSILLAGGGVSGGQVLGATDNIGAYPIRDRQSPENLAATIYSTLGIRDDAHWHDPASRPYPIYHAPPIAGLT